MIWEGFGQHLGRLGGGFGKDLAPLGTSWVVVGVLFFMLVFGIIFKSDLGSSWAGFWFDFQRFGMDFGRVLARFWKGFKGF